MFIVLCKIREVYGSGIELVADALQTNKYIFITLRRCYMYTVDNACHKNHMIECVIALWCESVTLLTTSMSTMRFLNEIVFILKAIKFHFQGSHSKQNLTFVAI